MATIALHRFSMVQVCQEFGQMAMSMFDAISQDEAYVAGRGLTIYVLFIGHLLGDIREQFAALNKGLEAASSTGDKMLHILNMGVAAAYRGTYTNA